VLAGHVSSLPISLPLLSPHANRTRLLAPGTNRTRLVPSPVLAGHAASRVSPHGAAQAPDGAALPHVATFQVRAAPPAPAPPAPAPLPHAGRRAASCRARRVRLVRGEDAACPLSTGGGEEGGGGFMPGAARLHARRGRAASCRARAGGAGHGERRVRDLRSRGEPPRVRRGLRVSPPPPLFPPPRTEWTRHVLAPY